MKLKEAAELALKALEVVREFNKLPSFDEGFVDNAINALRDALANRVEEQDGDM